MGWNMPNVPNLQQFTRIFVPSGARLLIADGDRSFAFGQSPESPRCGHRHANTQRRQLAPMGHRDRLITNLEIGQTPEALVPLPTLPVSDQPEHRVEVPRRAEDLHQVPLFVLAEAVAVVTTDPDHFTRKLTKIPWCTCHCRPAQPP
jgi:hypothetical protein